MQCGAKVEKGRAMKANEAETPWTVLIVFLWIAMGKLFIKKRMGSKGFPHLPLDYLKCLSQQLFYTSTIILLTA